MTKTPEVPSKYKDVPGVFPYTLNGRLMWFKPPGNGPIVLLQRFRAQLINMQRNNDPGYPRLAMDVAAKTLNVINGQFLDAEDRDWVEDLILTEAVAIEDVIPILAGGKSRPVADDDAEVEVAPKALRDKKPAAVAKVTPAKKAANAKRTRA